MLFQPWVHYSFATISQARTATIGIRSNAGIPLAISAADLALAAQPCTVLNRNLALLAWQARSRGHTGTCLRLLR